MIYRTLFMALVMPLAAAEDIVDPIALWAFGSGTRSDQPCSEGAVIVAGDALSAGEQPVRLELFGFPGSDVILRPGSSLRLSRDTEHRVVVELLTGGIEVDVRGSGVTRIVEVRGAALRVRGHDCLFLIERDDDDADYVAAISGQAMAGLRPGLSLDDGGMAILLQGRQGLRCSSANGLAEVDQLNERPQLIADESLQEQGQTSGTAESWLRDEAATATNDPPADGGLTALPLAVVSVLPVPPPPTVEPALPSPEPPPPPHVTVMNTPPVVEPDPPQPAPAVTPPVTSQSHPNTVLLEALSADTTPGWQRRGRTIFPTVR